MGLGPQALVHSYHRPFVPYNFEGGNGFSRFLESIRGIQCFVDSPSLAKQKAKIVIARQDGRRIGVLTDDGATSGLKLLIKWFREGHQVIISQI